MRDQSVSAPAAEGCAVDSEPGHHRRGLEKSICKRKVSDFDNIGLLELIQKTGIANAIATQLGALNGNSNAISETIENNVRSKIIKEHLNDPAFYDTMSALLDEIITARKTKAIEYESYE